MKFTSLEVENVFAYRGPSRLDLSACTDERNLVVVAGHNGAGKTSLLNAVKLLFLGAQDDRLRRVSFGGGQITAKHFVCGQPGRWYGVFNSLSQGTDALARIALEWDDAGRHYRVERTFRRNNAPSGFDESLNATSDGKSIPDGEGLLQQMLPREVVPFFFFDGEQIQSIADAEVGREQAEIERLLGLSFVAALLREVEVYAKAKQRAGIPHEARMQIVQAENARRESEARAELASHARIAVEEEIQELKRQQQRLESERSRLRTGISESERLRIDNRLELLGLDYGRLTNEVADQLPSEAPWLTNLDLVARAFELLEDELNRNADPGVAQRLHDELPVVLLEKLESQDPPVGLTPAQQDRFRRDVSAALGEIGVVSKVADDRLLGSLSRKQIQQLHARFLVWNEKGSLLAGAQAERLRNIRQVARERSQIRRDLDEAEITSDEARRHYERLTEEIAELAVRERERVEIAAEHRIEEQQARRAIANAEDQIRRAEAEFESVSRQNRGYQLGSKVKNALEDYRQQRRRQIREAVEARLNQHIGVLLAPSKLIKSVRLDDQFHMTYYDAQEHLVARRSISAGMRQLVAMSMLWALKDEANRPLPVVIDTPLGRIDRQNRALLMTDYFPHAGNPLILLPTDSEFGGEDFAQLAPRIARRYEILNADGRDARIVEVDIQTGQRLGSGV